MKEFRMGKNTKEHYTSFEEMGKAWGAKPKSKKTKNEKVLKEQQEKLCAKYRCDACGEPMTYIGGSMMTCTNENCKGIKDEKRDDEGKIVSVEYLVSYKFLRPRDKSFAENIFS